MRYFNMSCSLPAPRALRLVATLAAAAVAGACSDPYKQTATYTNVDQPLTVHALSGTPLYFATALSIPGATITKVDGSFSFDVAFDIDKSGNIVYLPPHMVGENPMGNRRVGIQKSAVPYGSIQQAPLSGYVFDSVTVARVGETVVVQTPASTCSLYTLPFMYAKIIIDSIEPVSRTLYGRSMVNQNCTFRSLAAGLPTN